jgi:hypothetical protein
MKNSTRTVIVSSTNQNRYIFSESVLGHVATSWGSKGVHPDEIQKLHVKVSWRKGMRNGHDHHQSIKGRVLMNCLYE